jgi:hypothetical protein
LYFLSFGQLKKATGHTKDTGAKREEAKFNPLPLKKAYPISDYVTVQSQAKFHKSGVKCLHFKD